MSQAIGPKHRNDARPVASDDESSAFDRDAVLEAAGNGDPRAVDELCDRHGAALIALARMIVGDAALADVVVTEGVVRACTDRGAVEAGMRSLRHELARLTYLHAVESAVPPPQAPGSALDKMAEAAELASRQRTAIALLQYGDYTIDDVAELLGLTHETVTALLSSGLRELVSTDGQDTLGQRRGPRTTGAAA